MIPNKKIQRNKVSLFYYLLISSSPKRKKKALKKLNLRFINRQSKKNRCWSIIVIKKCFRVSASSFFLFTRTSNQLFQKRDEI
jgi:hypothetical protein